MLTTRNIEILKAIVEEFVESAEPVGSKTLVEKYHLPYSSATIRNDMATLEMMGYLEKPHTSAGRIPSNKGYQFYCEHLIEKDDNGYVKNMVEKPANPATHYAVPPFYIYAKKDLPMIKKGIREGCGTDAPGSFIAYPIEGLLWESVL